MVLNIKKVMLLPLKRKIKIITHRIIGVKDTNGKVMYETKGDNNNGPDLEPVLAENVVGKYADITVPYVGYLLNYANSKAGAKIASYYSRSLFTWVFRDFYFWCYS